MAFEFLVIFFVVIILNVGQSYFTMWRMTSQSFLQGLFHRDNPLKRLSQNSDITVDELVSIKERITLVEQYIAKMPIPVPDEAGPYTDLVVAKVGEFIAQKFQESEKRSREVSDLASKIEQYGRVILTGMKKP